MGTSQSLETKLDLPTKPNSIYYKEYGKVYWEGKKVSNINASKFQDLGFGYGKTSERVFFKGIVLDEANSTEFIVNKCGYGKDDKHTFKNGKFSQDNCDFKILNNIRDNIDVQKPTKYVINTKQNTVSWGHNKTLKNVAHAELFLDLGGGYGKDIVHGVRGLIYYHDKPLVETDAVLFEYNETTSHGLDIGNDIVYSKGKQLKCSQRDIKVN
jgi:hypothetical protein